MGLFGSELQGLQGNMTGAADVGFTGGDRSINR